MTKKARDDSYSQEDHVIDEAVGGRVRERRLAMRISQIALAAHLGVTVQQVQKYEKGRNRISASMLVYSANLLKTTVSDLIGEAPKVTRGSKELDKTLKVEGAQELLSLYQKLSDPERNAVRALAQALAGEAQSDVF
ncbi:MAG: transcriptional regulator [Alphaproteobacteria bacterium PA2]|nr:MAG: transcriptional regulator [Alphaproteobacteria bacterium PA2]